MWWKEKNITKEGKEEGRVFFFLVMSAAVGYIIYNEFYKRKLEEKNEDLENQVEAKGNQIRMQKMIIKEKTNQLSSIISKIKLAESSSSWQRTKEGSKLAKKIFLKTRETFDKKTKICIKRDDK